MPPDRFGSTLDGLPAPLPIWHASVDRDTWTRAANDLLGGGSDAWLAATRTALGVDGRLVALWGSDRRALDGRFAIHAAYGTREGLMWLTLPLDAGSPSYPDISRIAPAAARMQRATADLLGLRAEGAEDVRPWLRHGSWPAGYHPLRDETGGNERFAAEPDRYAFVPVEGEGVHEIPVGPVHAGIIEPGHFRFSVVGEKVLRLEERLGYTHKGIDRLMRGRAPEEAVRLAGRVSGDSTVAYAWACCMALESLAGTVVPTRAAWLRALLLERERVANHLGDLGALGNDAALAFGLAQFSRLREDWLRLHARCFGHRLLMDRIVPGGVDRDLDAATLQALAAQCDEVEAELRVLRGIYDEHPGLQDRFAGTGSVTPELARRLGITGMAARASGVAHDLRADHPCAPYDELQPRIAGSNDGDVAARAAVRFDEALESLRLIREICRRLPPGSTLAIPAETRRLGFGAGWVEGWRGEVLVAVETDAEGRIHRCHCHDPSWQNWPALEHAIIGNIVPDFPLINKSFNLSYSGQDI
jgi:Ni,Fe-hydrogenase III large subunit/Ni,Fe-hydrogenase III component G